MAILPEGRVENVVSSLFKYIEAGFTMIPIDYAGAGIKEEDQDEWVRVDIMFPNPRYARQVDANNVMGAEQLVMLNANLFHKQSVHEENTYRQLRVRDTFADLFRVPQGIAVKDWVENAGANRIGTLQTSDLDSDNIGFDEGKGLYQFNVTSTMRYVMKWAPPD